MKFWQKTALLSLLLPSAATFSCRCMPVDIAAAHAKSDMVIYASVKDFVADIDDKESGTAFVEVKHLWKRAEAKKMIIRTTTSCAYPMAIGSQHLLFLTREANGFYSTDRCSGNVEGSEFSDLIEKLDKLEKEKGGHSQDS